LPLADENCSRFDVYNNVTPQQGVEEPAGDPIKATTGPCPQHVRT